jgi:putative acetyltransferase
MIGYVLAEPYWGRGYMTEAVERVLAHCFSELGLDLVSVYHFPFNNRSRRVIEKAGFVYEGTLRKASTIYDGSVYDDVCYSMTRDEYESRCGAL